MAGPGGQLLFTCFSPVRDDTPRHAVLCLPPFAEEMNKSRRMLAMAGRRFAGDGALFLLPDLIGTGDSAGEFADACLDKWRNDIRFATPWLYDQGIEEVWVLAVRFGSLLIQPFLDCAQQDRHRIVLWNPVTSGTTSLNQFFRMKLAAEMRSGQTSSVAELRNKLAEAGQIEIAGYVFSRDLAATIDEATLDRLDTDVPSDILWIDTGPVTGASPPPKTEALLSAWQGREQRVEYRRVAGQQFWMSPEIKEVPELLEVTADFLTDLR